LAKSGVSVAMEKKVTKIMVGHINGDVFSQCFDGQFHGTIRACPNMKCHIAIICGNMNIAMNGRRCTIHS
jgi:hypothetical protein